MKNNILLVSSLALAMGINGAQAVEKSANAKTVEVVVNANGFPLALLTITTILPVTMVTC
ncbi:hypothetical protein PIK69_07300 [Klebsiella pasteurii]|uniref:Uncharacterized protein n=1 Tax=Klebsiella pasteurii TaxID=2587529 RepID=A0ABT5CNX6_9ENTR|nr:hypothetical protein [Klebsiella pasteurii]MDC0693245.1 hypothetical protein [Klebsiella pasteurii]MDC0754814.1 hypothetical protein [Klebsiella pasteurii]